jgi:hypothetical protein
MAFLPGLQAGIWQIRQKDGRIGSMASRMRLAYQIEDFPDWKHKEDDLV